MKIGIMGGTFDPIHIGHLMLGEFAHDEFKLDKIWFMPNGNPPHKEIEDMDTKLEHRVAMTKLAIADIPYFELQDYEVTQRDTSYSYSTMEHFQQTNPKDEFYFIIGADSLFTLDTWCYPERLLKTCTMLAAFRDLKNPEEMNQQIQFLSERYEARIELLEAPLLEISSSDIRTRVEEGKTIQYMVPDSVQDYIKEHQLYETNHNEILG